MRDEIKNLIEELKGTVLDLHRSAGRLDRILQEIENEMNDVSEEYLKMFIRAQAQLCMDTKARDHKDLDEKEERIWQKLIAATKIEP